ncbi:MAG: N-acetylmuramoyl-L-alanine amidase, partial [Acidobacteria bacterium]|nr:N-acetylmuramoyl-L-alanine amidase [Acidobacteriota bacterium]
RASAAAAAAAPALKAVAIADAPLAAAQPESAVAFDFLKSEDEPKLFTPKIILAVVLVLTLLAVLVWEHWAPHPIPPPSVVELARLQPGSEPQPTVAPAPVSEAHLTEIKHWSKKDYTSIAVFLDGATKYDSAALHDPERIYFDLQDTTMPAEYSNKKELVVDVNDRLVSRVRAAQKGGSVTRVVLDLKAPAEYNTVLSADSPYRLMISIHPRGTKAVLPDPPAPEATLASEKESATPAASAPAPELNGRDKTVIAGGRHKLKIVIDPGHGGTEDGAIGRNGLKEKDLVLDVAHRLGTLLAMKLDAEVFYTRTDDRNVALEERTEYANQLQADMFVSVHANSSLDPNARGIETYYMDSASSMHEAEVAARENATSKKKVGNMLRAHLAMPEKIERSHKLATMVQQALYGSLADGQLKNRGVKRAPFVVLLGADMPAVLAEISFLSSPDDERALVGPDLRDRVADALYRGIAKYLAASKQEKQYLRSAALTGK